MTVERITNDDDTGNGCDEAGITGEYARRTEKRENAGRGMSAEKGTVANAMTDEPGTGFGRRTAVERNVSQVFTDGFVTSTDNRIIDRVTQVLCRCG